MLTLCALSMSGCQSKVLYELGPLNNWFWSRIAWSVVVSAVLGVAAARFLCQLPIRAPLMDCTEAARLRFKIWISILVLVITPFFLWFDAWFTQPFGQGNELSAANILSLVILDWRVLLLMFIVAVAFYLIVALFTRYVFARTCSCKYAFFPKQGAKHQAP
jgi:multisubunit Na+/H+ antiporter MnhB subunit